MKNRIRQLFTQAYKEMLGKGPTSVAVRDAGPVIEVSIAGVFTPVELRAYAVCNEDKKRRAELLADIIAIRQTAFGFWKRTIIRELENILGYSVSLNFDYTDLADDRLVCRIVRM